MNLKEIIKTARTLVADDKGLLAIDESNPTCNKRFAAAGIPQTEEFRRSYRGMIITTPGLGECISVLSSTTKRSGRRKKMGLYLLKPSPIWESFRESKLMLALRIWRVTGERK